MTQQYEYKYLNKINFGVEESSIKSESELDSSIKSESEIDSSSTIIIKSSIYNKIEEIYKNPIEIGYSFKIEKYLNIERGEILFKLFNKDIMDFIVKINTKYLKGLGFKIETQGLIENINKNITILQTLMVEMRDSGTLFMKHIYKTKEIVDNAIFDFLKRSFATICAFYRITGIEIEDLYNEVERKRGLINTENQQIVLKTLKDLISLREFSISGVKELINQDINVHWYNSNNELDLVQGRFLPGHFLIKPLKTQILNLRKYNSTSGILIKKSNRFLGRKSKFINITLTPNFLYIVLLESRNSKALANRLSKREVEIDDSLSVKSIESNILYSRDKVILSLNDYQMKSSEIEANYWCKMISIMKARQESTPIIWSSKPFPYSIIFAESGSIDIRAIQSIWTISPSIEDFKEFRLKLKKKFSTIIFPILNFESVDFTEYFTIESFLREIISNPLVQKDELILNFLGILKLENAIKLSDLKLCKKILKINKNCWKQTSKNKNIILYAIDKGEIEIVKLFINFNNKIKPLSPLFYSIEQGKIKFVKLFIKKNILTDCLNKSPLLFSVSNCENQHLEIIKMLIPYSNVNRKCLEKGFTCLHYAIDNSSNEVALELIPYTDLDIQCFKGNTPLMIAIERNNIELVSILLKKGANPNIHNNQGISSIHLASSLKIPTILTLILKNPLIKIDDLDNFNRNAIFYSIQNNSIECLKVLLEMGCSPNIVDNTVINPLHLAIINRNLKIIIELSKYGKLTYDLTNLSGDKPIHSAVDYNTLKFLIEKNVNINDIDSNGNTALHKASKEGDIKRIKLLLMQGANPNLNNNKRIYPIYLASLFSDSEISFLSCELFIEFKSNLLCKNTKKLKTILHSAVSSNNLKLCKYFIENESKLLNMTDLLGKTPLHLSVELGFYEISKFLTKKGANPNIEINGGQNVFSINNLNSSLKKIFQLNYLNYLNKTKLKSSKNQSIHHHSNCIIFHRSLKRQSIIHIDFIINDMFQIYNFIEKRLRLIISDYDIVLKTKKFNLLLPLDVNYKFVKSFKTDIHLYKKDLSEEIFKWRIFDT